MDVGVLWFYGLICIGFVVNNLIFCEIKIKMIIFVVLGNFILYLYDMKLQYMVGVGIVVDYFILSVDYDFNEEECYKDFKDNI